MIKQCAPARTWSFSNQSATPTPTNGIVGFYFYGLSLERQRERRRQMLAARFPAALVARLCDARVRP